MLEKEKMYEKEKIKKKNSYLKKYRVCWKKIIVSTFVG